MDEWLLRARRPRLVYALVLSTATTLVVAAPGGAILTVLLELPAWTAAAYAAIVTVYDLLLYLVPVLRDRDGGWARLEAWLVDGEGDPAAVAADAVTLVRRTVGTTIRIGVPTTALLNLVYWWAVSDSWLVGAVAAIGGPLAAGISFVLQSATGELLLRPVLTAASSQVPGGITAPIGRRESLAVQVLGVALAFAISSGFIGVGVGAASGLGLRTVLVGMIGLTAVTIVWGVTFVHRGSIVPLLAPIDDLVDATRRIADGDYAQPVPVTSEDELGRLAASVNAMQQGLRQREQLRAAFGSYVDPGLAERLLTEGGAVFQGERRTVTVLFVDVRDFTPYAETVTPEQAVARLNRFFTVVVEEVRAAGGHVNRFLGDGALAVFGAPTSLDGHADAAVAAATSIHHTVHDVFDGALRIGIGVNTGEVTAGTVGGAGKLEFTVIGDAVNVAARVEQLTKETGDVVLLTDATRVALADATVTTPRGTFELRGKSAPVTLHAVEVGATTG